MTSRTLSGTSVSSPLNVQRSPTVGLRVHRMRQRQFVPFQAVPRQGLHHGHGLVVGQAPQTDPLGHGLPAQLGQQLSERMASADVGVAVGPDDEQRHGLSGTDQVLEQQQRGLRGPVEIVQQENDRPPT